MELIRLRDELEKILRSTGSYIKNEQSRVRPSDIADKSLNNLVSFVDREAEKMLTRRLGLLLPGAGFQTEEDTVSRQADAGLRWIIDPLDGTTNYLYQLPVYSVSVALAEDDDLLLGGVYLPRLDEMFLAHRGEGTTLNGRPVSVSGTEDLKDSLVATGFPYYRFEHEEEYMEMFVRYMHHTRGIRRLGSAAVDLAYVACGRFDFYFEYDLNPWDVAAGLLLVEEAGGRTSDFSGAGSALSGKEILASNGKLHHLLVR